MKLVEAALTESPEVPVCVHLDHGPSFEMCKDCIDGGFTSVMIDGSALPYEENVALTKKVVDYAHPRGVWVEAHLAKLAGSEEHVKSEGHQFTDPDQAVDFVEKTGCDSLAVAIGTSHGAYKFKGEAKLDFPRLETICEKLPNYPLVLHGASSVPHEFVEECNKYGGNVGDARGVPEDMLRRAATMGVCKINVDTDIRLALTASIRKYMVEHPEAFDQQVAREEVEAQFVHPQGAADELFAVAFEVALGERRYEHGCEQHECDQDACGEKQDFVLFLHGWVRVVGGGYLRAISRSRGEKSSPGRGM